MDSLVALGHQFLESGQSLGPWDGGHKKRERKRRKEGERKEGSKEKKEEGKSGCRERGRDEMKRGR